MHGSEHPPTQPVTAPIAPTAPRRLPLWMLASMAFAFGPLLAWLLLDAQLAEANTWLVAALAIDVEQHSMLPTRLLLRVALPSLLLLGLLRFTRLGRWIVLTPIALGLLLVENALYALHVYNQVTVYVLNGDGLLRGLTKGPAQPIALTCMAVALVLLLSATAWHRSSAFRRWMRGTGLAWLRPL